MKPLFQALYNADADVVLGGHAHDYERFAPQNPSGQLDNARGIRQFVVGTGGAFFTSVSTPKPNSQVRQNNTYGVLKLTLHPTSYDWQFVPEAGKTFTDSGTGSVTAARRRPTVRHAEADRPRQPDRHRGVGPGRAELERLDRQRGCHRLPDLPGWHADREPSARPPPTRTRPSPASTSYSYTVRAVDAAGNLSDPEQRRERHDARHHDPHACAGGRLPACRSPPRRPTTRPSTLRTDGGTNLDTDSFLRFNVSGVVRQRWRTPSCASSPTQPPWTAPPCIRPAPTWSETAINWNNRPLRTSGAVGRQGRDRHEHLGRVRRHAVRDRQRHVQLQPRDRPPATASTSAPASTRPPPSDRSWW